MGSVQEKSPPSFLPDFHWLMMVAKVHQESEELKEAALLDGEKGEPAPDGQKKDKKASN